MQTGLTLRPRVPWQVHAKRSVAQPSWSPVRGRPMVARISSRQQDMLADFGERSSSSDIVALARRRALQQGAAVPEGSQGGLGEFMRKLRLAWQIFFPERPQPLTPKEEGKRRLRMILVADRCGMSEESLADMRQNIVRVVSDYIDIEAEDLVETLGSLGEGAASFSSSSSPLALASHHQLTARAVQVNLSMDPELGTIYSVAVPVKRVKPQARMLLAGEEDQEGLAAAWDPNDPNSDPSSQFPYGA